MRYDLTDFEWSVIAPVLPKGRPGPRRKDDRRVMNGIFWVLRAGAPWRDLPGRYGPYTTAYNRFSNRIPAVKPQRQRPLPLPGGDPTLIFPLTSVP